MDEDFEDDEPIPKEPVGTPVAVFRVDGSTFVGYGVIEAWLRFSEIPDEKDETEKLADTDRIGVPAVNLEDAIIFNDDGTTELMSDALAEVIEENEWENPRIRLENGEVTYGCRCYYKLRSEHEENINN